MRYAADVLLCALAIYEDLTRSRPVLGFRDLVRLCEKHGGAPLPASVVSHRQGAIHTDGNILISPGLDLAGYAEAIPHELVHRLAATERYAWLNPLVEGWRYDRRQFRESVARAVGLLFLASFLP